MKKARYFAVTGIASAALVGGLLASTGASAAPAPLAAAPKPAAAVSGPQGKGPLTDARGRPDAKYAAPRTAAKGKTQVVAHDTKGRVAAKSIGTLAGSYSQTDLLAPINYCYRDWVYAPVKNTTTATQWVRVELYVPATSTTQVYYATLASGSTAYPYFTGVTGTYYVYLYRWNGSSYAYDEYRSSSNVCNVSISAVRDSYYTYYARETIKNNGTAYATVSSQELAPYAYGPYYDYPTAGGAAITRYFYIGTPGTRWAVVANVSGSSYDSWNFAGN